MAEGSGFWDKSGGGHALGAVLFTTPYSSVERASFFNLLMGDGVKCYVIGGVNNSLNVQAQAVADMSVLLKSGKALIRGFEYYNDADKTIVIQSADPTNPRIDLICVQIDFTNQLTTTVCVTGTAAAAPSRPALTQSAVTYQIAIAEVWVAAAAASIADTVIHDLREFLISDQAVLSGTYPDNMIYNSEIMSVVNGKAAGYVANGSNNTFAIRATHTAASWHTRGLILNVAATNFATDFWATDNIPVEGGATYTLKTSIQPDTANTTGSQVRVVSNGTGALNIQKNFLNPNVWEESRITFTVPNDATFVTISWRSLGNAKVTWVGPSILCKGYVTGPWRQFHETIMYHGPVSGTGWTATTKSTATNAITIGESGAIFNNIPKGVRALILQIEIEDTGSLGAGAGTVFIAIGPSSGVTVAQFYIAGEPNSFKRGFQCMTPVTAPLGDPSTLSGFSIGINASGVNTMTATVRIVGIVT
jgi:hypothetical protein